MSSRRGALYLQIPAEYCRPLGGFRWARYGEAVEFLDGPDAGRTFAFAAEIALFLEGVQAAGDSCLSFGFVLHLLYLVGLGERATGRGSKPCVERLAEPFHALGCPLRNAGALCGWLCRDVPRPPDPPDLAEVRELLGGGSWVPQMVLSHPMLGALDQAEQPPLEPGEFAVSLERASDALSDHAIRHWLEHGRGPVGPGGERVAQLRPRGLAGVLAVAESRPRLSGAAHLAGRLEGMLSLPSRRLDRVELRSDGYSDVATRGSPEQILPMQFALDGEEFLRRFAERELLYFHREEPRQPTTEELVLLLDQGVRTWGDVRLVLVGAALALARQALGRRIGIKLAVTGVEGDPVDPNEIEPQALAALLEASDLSPNPGRALANLLRTPAATRRDVVLLTHPRNVVEPEVAAAARSPAVDDDSRLFAVTVDASGRVELAELRRGLPVVLGRNRIDVGDGATTAPPASHRDVAARTPWRGDVEPIPFPFRTGGLDQVDRRPARGNPPFDFDDSGERILVIGSRGLLYARRIDGTETEMLPRPFVEGRAKMSEGGVIGVAGGFVLVSRGEACVILAHYDFPTRTCTVHTIKISPASISWSYHRDLHAIAGSPADREFPIVAIDLSSKGGESADTPRARRAVERAVAGIPPYPLSSSILWTSPSDPWIDSTCRAVRHNPITGSLYYKQEGGDERSLTPLTDGRPALKAGRLVLARQGGDVLAVMVEGGEAPGLYFISLSKATVLGTCPFYDRYGGAPFALSRDGHRFARVLGDGQLEIRDVLGGLPPVLATTREGEQHLHAALGRSCLLVGEIGPDGPRSVRSRWLIRWDRGRLDVFRHDPVAHPERLLGIVATSKNVSGRSAPSCYDPGRFDQSLEHGGLRVLIDRYNHVVVLDRRGELLCMFHVTGDGVAAWMPDGTYLGPRRIIGGEPTPGAAERLAAVLGAAERGGPTSS